MRRDGLRAAGARRLRALVGRLDDWGPTVRLALRHRDAAIAFARGIPTVRSLGTDAVAWYADLVAVAADADGAMAARLATALPDALVQLPAEKRGSFGRIVRRVISERPEAVPMVVEQLPVLLRELDEADAASFVSRALDLYGRSSARAQSFLRRESDAGQQLARSLPRGVALEDVRRVLAAYASAHCDEEVEIVAGDGEPHLQQRGSRWVATVPARIADYGDRRDFLAYRVLVARCAGHLEFGTYDVDVGALCAGFPEPALALELFNVLEEIRVERRVRREYPGIDRDLARLDRRRPPVRGEPAVAQLVAALRAHGEDLPLPAGLLGAVEAAVHPLLPKMDAIVRPPSTVADVAAALPEFYAAAAAFLEGRPPLVPPPPPPPPEGGEGAPSPGGTGGEGDREGQGDESTAEPAAEGAAATASEGAFEALEAAVAQEGRGEGKAVRAAATGGDPSFEYPEWDYRIADYKPAWVRVVEHPVDGDGGEFVAGVHDRHGPLIRRLRRAFEAMRPEAARRMRGLVDGDELDIDAAIESRVVRRAGGAPTDRLYSRRLPLVRDVAAAFLIDLSSSTSEIVNADGQRIIEVEKEALVCIAEALDALGDRFAIHGFSGYGRDHVAFYVAKDFDEPLDDAVRARVGGLRWKMENRDGAAIRHCTRRLLEVPARRRLLFLLSDGRPLDCGCDQYFDRYAWQDTRMALREARQQGIHAFCTTVDPRGSDYLESMYGAGSYVVVERVEALPARLLATYRRVTR